MAKLKDVYEYLESTDIDNKDELIGVIKEVSKARDSAEIDARQSKKELEQYSELDIAKLKTVSKFIEGLGGVDGVQALKAKAEGYEEDKQKLEKLSDDYKALESKFTAESDANKADLKRARLEAKTAPIFVKNFLGGDTIMEIALNNNLVDLTDSGIVFKSGDEVIPLDNGGLDKLREHPKLKEFALVPDGGNTGSDSGKPNDNSGGDSGVWW